MKILRNVADDVCAFGQRKPLASDYHYPRLIVGVIDAIWIVSLFLLIKVLLNPKFWHM